MLYGGNLFKVERISKERYKEIEGTLIPILERHFGDHYRIPIPYHNKSSYGDVDIILDAGFLLNKNWERPLLEDMGHPEVKRVQNVLSTLYMDFQVDFFCVATSRFHSTYNFMCYNILGNLIGRLYHKFNLKYGEEGLKYVLRSFNNHITKEIVITRDMRSILEFIGLDYNRWVMGFDNVEDIYDYVIGSKYFCVDSYSEKYYTIRKRMFERPDFNKFLDYLKDHKIEKNFQFDKNKDIYLPLIDAAFPKVKLIEVRDKHLQEQVKLEEMSKKFNGLIVMDLIPLEGKALGQFINAYKEWKGEEFETFILESPQGLIDHSIKNFYSKELSENKY